MTYFRTIIKLITKRKKAPPYKAGPLLRHFNSDILLKHNCH